MRSLESLRSDGMRDRRAGYAKCDYPDKLSYDEISWWTAGWELEDKKQQARKLHPLRCETCKFATKLTLDASKCPVGDPYPEVYACSKQEGKWMPSAHDGNPIAIVGCASHQDFKKEIIDMLEKLYNELENERENKIFKTSYDYRDGRCDAIDLAIQKLEEID